MPVAATVEGQLVRLDHLVDERINVWSICSTLVPSGKRRQRRSPLLEFFDVHLLRRRRLRFFAIISLSRTLSPIRRDQDDGHAVQILSPDAIPDAVRSRCSRTDFVPVQRRHHFQHVFRIRFPVGRHVENAAQLELAFHQLGKRCLNDTAFIMTRFVPWVREKS